MIIDIHKLLDHAIEASRIAGAILMEGFGKPLSIQSKEGIHNLVTEYDTRSEAAIIEYFHRVTPGATVLAEESGQQLGDNELAWIIDPLDGTVNFAHGIPIFCVSIAATFRGEIVCGVVYNPVSNELFTATLGGGAFLGSVPLHVSNTTSLMDAILVTGFPYNVVENPLRCIDQFTAVVRKGLPVRRLGSAALDLAYTAAGRFDAYWESILQPWDMAAGVLLVTEAGGRITRYHNAPFVLSAGSIIASNNLVHEELASLLELP